MPEGSNGLKSGRGGRGGLSGWVSRDRGGLVYQTDRLGVYEIMPDGAEEEKEKNGEDE